MTIRKSPFCFVVIVVFLCLIFISSTRNVQYGIFKSRAAAQQKIFASATAPFFCLDRKPFDKVELSERQTKT